MTESEFYKRGDRVHFKGNDTFRPYQNTYVWAVGGHMGITYYIQHPDGDLTKERIRHNGGLPDGFETPHSEHFKEGLKYICVLHDELESVK